MYSIKITAANLSQSVIIDTPCSADWNKMTGSDSVRFCHSCKLNVYDISQFSDSEAEEIFAQNLNGNRMCTRIYRRQDGTIMTDNCPRALRRLRDLRNRTFTALAKVAALATLFLSACLPSTASNDNDKDKSAPEPSKIKSKPLQSVQPIVSPGYAKSPPIQVLGGVPVMPDLTSYMQQLRTTFFKAWKQAGNPKQSDQELATSVSFTIEKNGTISRLKVIKTSKQPALDEEALKAVKKSLPLPPPPLNVAPLDVEFTFEAKMGEPGVERRFHIQTEEKNDGH